METQRIFFNPSDLGLRSLNRQTSFDKAIKAFDPEFSHIATQGGSQGIDGHGTVDTWAAWEDFNQKKTIIYGYDLVCSQM